MQCARQALIANVSATYIVESAQSILCRLIWPTADYNAKQAMLIIRFFFSGILASNSLKLAEDGLPFLGTVLLYISRHYL